MLKTVFLSLLVLSVFGKPFAKNSRSNLARDASSAVEQFPWSSFKDKTGVDEAKYLNPPAEGVSVTYARTTKPGPEPGDCPDAFGAWEAQAVNDLLHVDAGQCASITSKTCQVVVCAPLGELSIKTDEVVGRMWNPLSIKCVMGGTGGIYQSEDSEFVIGVARPVQ